MKKLEWLALLLIILCILTHFLSWFGTALITRLYSPEFVSISNLHLKLITSARSLLLMIVNLVIGIWLFIQASRSKNTPWIWLLFGMVYGLIAAVLFYLQRIFESKSPNNANVPLPDSTA
ncbi:MAG: hypothetical protein ACYS6W_08435 [Planctomycetota bacterium]